MTELATWLPTYLPIIYFLTSSITAAPATSSPSNVAQANYGVLLDAGSTSTKLKVYRWNQTTGDSLVPRIDLLANERFDNGLGSFEEDEIGLVSYISSIVSRAKQDVPDHKQKSTPIYLMATAGLRYLTEKEAEVFLEKIQAVLANTTINPFLYKSSSITILSGEEEGVYSWIAANYLNGFFDKYRPENETVGILEMGGGSTQIAFIPHGPLFSEEYQAIVAGRAYQLYVQSYLQFGANAISQKVVYALLHGSLNQSEVENPCMLREDSRNTTLDDGRLILEKGTGDPEACLQILRKFLHPNTGQDCSPKPCAIGSVYQPSVDNLKFVATQAFTYTPENLKVVDDDKILHIDKLEEAAIYHCNRTLEQAVNESGMDPQYVSSDCLMGLYIPTLVTLSYGFNSNSTNIQLTSKINGGTVDWALGAMLVELSNSFGSPKFNYSIQCTKGMPAVTTGYNKGNHSTSLHSNHLQICVLLLSLAIVLRNCIYFDISKV
ncbi:unnamed protein product [Candidula unifasciata]|uniref:Apyrase n=1 Tax=Candidula unifasciata TaxID=100452 RepID=A0A8S3ZWU9_9EUPU|nr:unnamed protein product [Candidula unifasciata]